MSKQRGSTTARFVKNDNNRSKNNKEKNYNVFSRSKGPYGNNSNNNNNNPINNVTKLEAVQEINRIDEKFGFSKFESGPAKTGWLSNMHPTTIVSEDVIAGVSGVDYYFLDEEGGSFKASVQYDPYFLLICKQGTESEVEEYLIKVLEKTLKRITRVEKDDLEMSNHLMGLKRSLLRLNFHNISDLLEARRFLSPIIESNKKNKTTKDIYTSMDLNYNQFLKENGENQDDNMLNDSYGENNDSGVNNSRPIDVTEYIEDIREYDVPYHVRVSIDKDIRVGKWYKVEAHQENIKLTIDESKIAFADPVVLAFDIETTKAPLKFPDSSIDQIMMISYMIDGDGFLITNREIISEDIEDFEYTPKPEYPGYFTIFNEPNEKALIERFFEHIKDVRPTVIATFNGDFFDWPFVEARALFHDIDMFKEIGFAKDNEGEYKSSYCTHMDCFRWVKRDSYLPQGSQGLKAVTTVKLGYNPTELDPELMTPYAYEKPQLLSEYSVSDAVATFYLYSKYVHPFVFSLCTIIPLNPDEVLRKGTGTLCEMLLMVQAYENGILLPNKHTDPLERFYNGHLLESETYVGGHVESLEAGVFRADLEYDFNVDPLAIDEIIVDLESALKFSIEVEANQKLEDVTNFDEIYQEIKTQLLQLKANPKRHEKPLIYHVDVASMYPNIMTTNRLQPDSMKTEKDCAACDFNRPGKQCDRRLNWSWRGEYYPAEMNEYSMIKNALRNETFPPRRPGLPRRTFDELSYADQVTHIKKRTSDYSRKVYHRIKQSEVVEREAIVCQRENPFYVNTVRSFRDRRYDFKGLAKKWKGKAAAIPKSDKHAIDEAKKMIVLYDSLQLAHKVILNSFYGYVMRKGSRWYSMEMAGITCLTGATIIQMARSLVERLGRPLELDTDGIWCILPSSFPENFNFKLKNGKKVFTTYPCSMLNYLVHQKFTNHQYQELIDPVKLKYKIHADNSIFFEVDGPYKAMILPTSKEEGKGLKKRYAVFNFDGSLAELKGFELKRRGELQLIKNFQSDIFKLFLEGETLEGCYQSVANVANRWLDVLETKGTMLEDEDLIELICENRSMSKTLEEYGDQKSTSITTAKRLGEFLGEEMVKDKGLACKYIIAGRPLQAPVTERAIPTAIFSSEISVKRKYLRRWLTDPALENFDPRTIIDWDYYRERLASVIQKIITIPAALQGVKNPVPRVSHPDWLQKKIDIREDKFKQSDLSKFLVSHPKGTVMKNITNKIQDMEDFGMGANGNNGSKVAKVTSRKRKVAQKEAELNKPEDEENQRLLNQPCPSALTDYVGFLQYQKIKWGVQQKERIRRKKLFGDKYSSSDRSAVGDIIRKQAEHYANSTWQILQYKEDPNNPGDIKVHVLIDSKIQTLTFRIQQKVYLSLRDKKFPDNLIPLGAEVQLANEALPNGHDNGHLFKLEMSYAKYFEESKKPDGIFQHPNVSAVYQSQIGSIERAIIELGSCVKFDNTNIGALGKCLERGFDQKNLKPLPQDNYLLKFNIGMIYVLHVISNQYEIFAVFKSWDKKASILCLKPSNSAQELPSNINSVYSKLYQRKKAHLLQNYNIIEYPEEMDFTIDYYTDVGKLHKKLNNVCSKFQEEKATKVLVTIQSPYSSRLVKLLKSLNDSPVVQINSDEVNVPALNWQSLITKRIINHYLALAISIKRMMTLSKYGNIPLCNLKVNNMGYLIDIEYSRRLQKAGIVLWWSPKPLPDYGGFENDRNLLLGPEESLEFPVVNRPEMYETVCLEVEVKNLTINTVLTSAVINEAEGVFGNDITDVKTEDPSDSYSTGTFAEDSFYGPALAVLRGMVREWWDDAVKDNSDADSMVHGFISWVQNPASHLYNPSLNYHVHNLTKKSLIQLLGEFRKMGSSIVFADRNKIILRTNKTAVENSYAYGNYIINTARSRPLFNFLDFSIVKYWDVLIWMDKYNFSGRYCNEISNGESQDLDAVSKWQLRSFLPPILQEEFDDWAVTILDALIRSREDEYKSSQNGTGALTQSSPRRTQITQILKSKKFIDENEELENLSVDDNNLCGYIRKGIIKRVRHLIRKQNEAAISPEMEKEYSFPKLPGSCTHPTNPTLEMVKFLAQILSLSKRRNIEARMLRKELLALFEIREFSEEGAFKNPTTSLKIPQVICEYCGYTTDIDICRDEEKILWHCDFCQKPYNKLVIEERLISELQKLFTTYLTQDLKCEKCSIIKSNEMSSHCACSGNWINTISKNEIIKRSHIFGNISSYYELNILREVTDEIL
ncbi:hypothetical protein B5S31_g336 [[Candida] boidinii]|nr:hypothetical protein B5S31_g336 [[Candida] boidinii]